MALYHVHRPQDYNELIGQEYIVKTLSNQVATGKVAHAYLFSGPRGVGKTTTARILSKAVNCVKRKDGDPHPCNTCTSCEEITAGNAIDVIEIDAASNTGVDNVRANIIENAQFKPTKSAYKIFIIDEVHMLSTSAFNALLKIMEEPPSHVLFILATTELHKIPETIISRCQRYQFKRVPYEILKKHLVAVTSKEAYEIDPAVIDRIILKSDGCVRDAMSLLDQLMALGTKHIDIQTAALVLPTASKEHILAFITAFFERNPGTAFTALSRITAEHSDLLSIADDCIDMLRHIMILRVHKGHEAVLVDMSAEAIEQLTQLGTQTNGKDIVAMIDLLFRRRQEIKAAPIPGLPLELAIIEWCDTKSAPIPALEPPVHAPANTTPSSKNTSPPKEPEIKKDEMVESSAAPETPAIPSSAPEVPQAETQKEQEISAASFSKSDVEKNWGHFLTAVEKTSPSLVFVLKMASIIRVDGAKVILSVPYSFHKDKLTDPKCRDGLQKTFSELLKTKVELDVIVTTEPAKKEELDELASLVGGQVI